MQLRSSLAVLISCNLLVIVFEGTTASQNRHFTINDGGSSESSSGEGTHIIMGSRNKPSVSYGQASEQLSQLRQLNGQSTHIKNDDLTHTRAMNLSEASHSHKNVQVLNIGPINSNQPRPKTIAYVKFPKTKYPKKSNGIWGSYIWPRKDAPELRPLPDYSPESDEITLKIPKVKITKTRPRINWRLGSDSESEEKFLVYKKPHHPEDSSGPDSSSSSSESKEDKYKSRAKPEELSTTASPRTLDPKTPKLPPMRTLDDNDSPEEGPTENDVYKGTTSPSSTSTESSNEKMTTDAPTSSTTEAGGSLDTIEKRKRNRRPNFDVTSQAPPDGDDDLIGVIPDESSCDKYAITGTEDERNQEPAVAAGFRQGGSTQQSDSNTADNTVMRKSKGKNSHHHHHHHHSKLSFRDVAPKFNMHRRRLATLINRMVPHCPEIHGPKLLSIWSQLFKHSFPSYAQKSDESSKYSEDVRLQLGLCFQRMLDNNFGLDGEVRSKGGNENSVQGAAKEEAPPGEDGPKVKRSPVDLTLLGQSFHSEVAAPIVKYFLDLPLIVENAIRDASGK